MIRARLPFVLLIIYGAVRAGFTAFDDDGGLRMLSEPQTGMWALLWLAIAVASVPALIRPAVWGLRALAAVTAAGVVGAWSWKVFVDLGATSLSSLVGQFVIVGLIAGIGPTPLATIQPERVPTDRDDQ